MHFLHCNDTLATLPSEGERESYKLVFSFDLKGSVAVEAMKGLGQMVKPKRIIAFRTIHRASILAAYDAIR